jgi:hypothetical protein
MGYGATRSLERVAAAMGALEAAPIIFEAARDVSQGGVLLALPALLAVGLLRHSAELYALPKGFYGLSSVLVLLALMALARIASIEQLRYAAAGEWGNLLGLDRVPEVRTLREKLKLLCAEQGRAARWNAALAKEWIGQREIEQSSGLAFYIDGHVRVYHGELTKLPRHYVPRERFYLRATVDYWVNALDGEPFCYFNQAVDHGLVQALRGDVLPWLEANVSVSAEHQRRMAEDPRAPRFTVIVDREGYSPDLFLDWQKERIAALTYHRYPDGEDWRAEEFQEQTVKLVNGEAVRMKLAERGTHVGKRPGLWVREVRKLAPDGHQVSIVSTNFTGDAASQAVALMARWSQENFFKYMREHFGLDALVQYGTEEIPAAVTVLNPAWRVLDGEVRKKQAEWKSLQKLQRNVGPHATSVGSGGPQLRAASRPSARTYRATPAGVGTTQKAAPADAPPDLRSGPPGTGPLHAIAHGEEILPGHPQDDCLSRRNQHGFHHPRNTEAHRRCARFTATDLRHRGRFGPRSRSQDADGPSASSDAGGSRCRGAILV